MKKFLISCLAILSLQLPIYGAYDPTVYATTNGANTWTSPQTFSAPVIFNSSSTQNGAVTNNASWVFPTGAGVGKIWTSSATGLGSWGNAASAGGDVFAASNNVFTGFNTFNGRTLFNGVVTNAGAVVATNLFTLSNGLPVSQPVLLLGSEGYSGGASGVMLDINVPIGFGGTLFQYTRNGVNNFRISASGAITTVAGDTGVLFSNTDLLLDSAGGNVNFANNQVTANSTTTVAGGTGALGNVLLKASGTTVFTAGTNFVFTTVPFGIGTNAPSALLHVTGNGTSSTNLPMVGIYGHPSRNADFFQIVGAASVTNVFNISKTGQIGIGVVASTNQMELPLSTVPTGGISFGGDVGIYRSAGGNMSTMPGTVFNSAGTFQVAGTTVITAGQLVRASIGNAGAPSFSFATDSDTGMYREGANAIGWTGNGIQFMRGALGMLQVTNLTYGGYFTVPQVTVTNVMADFGNIIATGSADLTYPVTGAVTNMVVNLGRAAAQDASLNVVAMVSSNGFVTIRAQNVGSLAVDQANVPYRISVETGPTQ